MIGERRVEVEGDGTEENLGFGPSAGDGGRFLAGDTEGFLIFDWALGRRPYPLVAEPFRWSSISIG